MNYELKSEIKQTVNAELLKECKFLENFSQLFVIDLLQKFNEQTLQPNDYIFKTGCLDECCLYFIHKGKVEMFYGTTYKTRNQLIILDKKNNYFGEVSFFTGMAHEINAYCLDFTIVMFITREEFIIQLKEYPQDYEIFCEIKDKILLYHDYKNIYRACLGCGKFDHLEIDCNLLHLKLNKQTVISKYNYFDPKLRIKKQRRLHKSLNSCFHNTNVFQSALIYIMQNNDQDLVEEIMAYINEMNGQLDRIIYEENIEEEDDDNDNNDNSGVIAKELQKQKYYYQFLKEKKKNFSQTSENQLTFEDFLKMTKNESKVILSTIIRQQKKNISENIGKKYENKFLNKSFNKHGTLPIKFSQRKLSSVIQNKKEAMSQNLNFFDDIHEEQNNEQIEQNQNNVNAIISPETNIYKNTFIYHTPQKACGPCDCTYNNNLNKNQIQSLSQKQSFEICMESKQSYQKYFPHNNIEIILNKFKQLQYKRILNSIKNSKLAQSKQDVSIKS